MYPGFDLLAKAGYPSERNRDDVRLTGSDRPLILSGPYILEEPEEP